MALYVKHLEELKTVASIRENERRKKRQTESSKKYEEYDWPLLIQSGTLQTLKVKERDKYLAKHSLPTVGRKDDKVKRITADYYIRNNTNSVTLHTRTDETDSDSEQDSESGSGSDDDEVIRIIPESGHDSTDEEQFSDAEIIGMGTGFGRRAARFSSWFQDFSLLIFRILILDGKKCFLVSSVQGTQIM